MRPALFKEGGQVARFLIGGGISVVVYYALLYGLTDLVGVWYVASAAFAFAVYFGVNFSFHKFWAFRNMDQKVLNRQLMWYTTAAGVNWVLNTTFLYLLVEYLALWYMLAQAILTIVSSIASYFVFRWIFRHRSP
jgi:putative flippase GtrA